MQALRAWLEQVARHYLVALQHFSRVPLSGAMTAWTDARPVTPGAVAAHWPGVGMLLGMSACLVFAVVSLALQNRPFTPFVAAVACILATVLITGALHERGLAALAHRLDAGADGVPAQLALQNASAGASGTLALVFSVAARVGLLALLASVSPGAVIVALLAGNVVSRVWPLLVMHSLPPAGHAFRPESEPAAGPVDRRTVIMGAAWAVVPLLLMGAAGGFAFVLLAVGASALAWHLTQRLLASRLQGFSRDGLGATQQICETAFYLGAGIGLGR